MPPFPDPKDVADIFRSYPWSKTLSVTTGAATTADISPFVTGVIDEAVNAGIQLKGVRLDSVYHAAVNAPPYFGAKAYKGVMIVQSPSLDDLIEFVVK
ncbi:hypothetical protein [Brevundimonas sp.]|uniref:hypothetical protein n=1 Tax=Brevundimonas sp. TaxID=1871086 RepID=UPI00257C2E21|nr:hypothetical protein [Brevundimonas sp.]